MNGQLRLATGLLAATAALASCGTMPASQTFAPSATPSSGTSSTSDPSTTGTPSTTTTSRPTTPAHLVGLGDSVTAGSACGCTPFVNLYAAMLAQHSDRRVTSTNLGKGGLTTTSMAAQLTDPSVRKTVAGADVVVVTIGANDLIPLIGEWQEGKCASACISQATAAMQARLDTVLASLNTEVQPGAKVLVTNYWNVFEDGDVADRDYGAGFAAWSDAVTKSANVAISAAAANNAEQVVDIYEPFEGNGDRNPTSLLAADGDHPNAAGHRLIAEALDQASPTLGVPS